MAIGFHEVRFPLRIALETSGGPQRRTDIVDLSNGRESRNARWRNARRRYDAGSGVRAVGDLYAVLAFFEARHGQLYGFRFRDPIDFSSAAPHAAVTATDQELGVGDGQTRTFQLAKTYADAGGGAVRPIAKPVAGSVLVAVAGAALAPADFDVDVTTGLVTFGAERTPAEGAVVTAGFTFDVPVRFDADRLELSLSAFNAGRIPSIPLVEIAP